MDRRTVLRRSAGIVMAGLAGCTGGTDGTGDGGGGESTTEPSSPSPTPSPTASPEPTPTETETPPMETAEPMETETATPSPTPTPEPTAAAGQTVEVAPDGSFRFKPEEFTIAVGETVRWVWRAGGHNVKVESTPAGSDWGGTPGGESDTFGEGHTYSYTFDVAGQYEYYCAPHRSLGMTGQFTVE